MGGHSLREVYSFAEKCGLLSVGSHPQPFGEGGGPRPIFVVFHPKQSKHTPFPGSMETLLGLGTAVKWMSILERRSRLQPSES